MSPSDERHLYDTDKRAWARHAAPRWADMLRKQEGGAKKRTWAMAGPEMRDELRKLAHTGDPDTSRQAAARHIASGARDDHISRIMSAVRDHPGRTSAELAQATGLERHEAARRTSDAEHAGLIRKGPARKCSISGRSAVTWELVQAQRERAA